MRDSDGSSSDGSVRDSNWGLGDSVDWGGVGSHDSLGGVGLDCVMVDVGGLDNLEKR